MLPDHDIHMKKCELVGYLQSYQINMSALGGDIVGEEIGRN